MRRSLIIIASFLTAVALQAQPYVDILNLNTQLFHSAYTDSLRMPVAFHGTLFSSDLNAGATIPIRIAKTNEHYTILLKPQFEQLNFEITGPQVNLSSHYQMFGFAAGVQVWSHNNRWKSIFMIIPRYCVQRSGGETTEGFQSGGTVLESWSVNERLKLRFGLYYNREFFGNFFVPLVGVDWKMSEKWRMFGVLPNNMRIENTVNDVLHWGVAYKNYQRSYVSYISQVNALNVTVYDQGYLRMRESEAKIYADLYLSKKFVLFADAGYSLTYKLDMKEPILPLSYGVMETLMGNEVKQGMVYTIGVAFRLAVTDPVTDKTTNTNTH